MTQRNTKTYDTFGQSAIPSLNFCLINFWHYYKYIFIVFILFIISIIFPLLSFFPDVKFSDVPPAFVVWEARCKPRYIAVLKADELFVHLLSSLFLNSEMAHPTLKSLTRFEFYLP